MARFSMNGLLVAILLIISMWNAASALHRYFHWPVLVEDDWTRLDNDLTRAKVVLNGLPDRHIEYRTEEANNSYGAEAFFRLQYILTPAILQRDPVDDGYVIVEFWTTKKPRDLPGLTLVEDFGHGLALYRKPSSC